MSRVNNRQNQQKRSAVPNMVKPNMVNGCESMSCKIAREFYLHNEKVLRNSCTTRESAKELFLKTFRKWATDEMLLRENKRNFNQVLFNLVRDGGVCQVVENPDTGYFNNVQHDIIWY